MEIDNIDFQKDINKTIFKYNNEKRILIALAFLIMFVLGLSFILIENLFTIIFGFMLVVIGIFRAFDILFFKELIFSENAIIKRWYLFGQKKILFSNLRVTTVKRVWSGMIFFGEKNDSIIDRQLMSFETFPIGNLGARQIKKIMVENKIIKGDEHEWNY